MSIETLEVRWPRESARYRGTSLRGLLTLLGVPAGEALRGDWPTSVATLVATDGYQVVFSLGELEPTLTGRLALVAYERDDKPPADNEAPLRLVVEGDRRPTRSIRQLVAIRVSEPLPRTGAGHQ